MCKPSWPRFATGRFRVQVRGVAMLPRSQSLYRWSALLALVFCLPLLTLIGSGWCPLLAAQPSAPSVPAHCAGCCSPTASAMPPAQAPLPTPTLPCCEMFKALQSVNLGSPGFKAQQTPPADGAALLGLPTFLCPNDGHSATRAVLRCSASVAPLAALLQLVSRRCFPSLAPPLPAVS